MRRDRLLSNVLLAATLALTAHAARAQTATGAFYNRPVELKLQAAAGRTFGSYHKQYPGQAFYTENFYPIGWSKDGNFAYYIEPFDEACGCYFAKLLIVDLKTDKVLWKFEHEGDSLEEDKAAGKPYSLATLWRANRKLFSQKLREHRIEAQGPNRLLSFPATYAGDVVTADFKTKEREGLGDQGIYGVVGNINLQLNSKRNGKKTVLDYTYTEEGIPLYVGLLGYVKSPFEPRIAVIMIEIIRGYEGPPNVGLINIAGAHLATGFK
jgi:hypothetical protein